VVDRDLRPTLEVVDLRHLRQQGADERLIAEPLLDRETAREGLHREGEVAAIRVRDPEVLERTADVALGTAVLVSCDGLLAPGDRLVEAPALRLDDVQAARRLGAPGVDAFDARGDCVQAPLAFQQSLRGPILVATLQGQTADQTVAPRPLDRPALCLSQL